MSKIGYALLFTTIAFVFSCLLSSCGGSSSSNDNFKLIPVKLKDKGKISLMDLDGKIVLEDEYSAESKFVLYTEGIVCEGTKDGKVKYYSINGNKSKQIGDEYYDGIPFYNGYAVVKKENGMLCLIDKEGKEKISNLSKIGNTTIVRAGAVSEDLIRFKNDEGLWGYLNLSGEIVIKPTYSACENFNKGMARVIKSNGLFSIINKTGEEQFKGKDKFTYGRISEELIAYKENTGEKDFFGFMNMKGEKVIKDSKYTSCGNFKNGLVAVKEEDKDSWGVINNKGEVLGDLKTKYDSKPYISNDGKIYIYDEDKKKTRVFNDKGEDLKNDFEDYKHVFPLSAKSYLVSSKSDKWAIVDEKGKDKSKDQFYIESGIEQAIELGIDDYAAFGNLLTIESSYYDFDALFKDVFKSISVNGAFDITANSTFGQVMDQYKYQAPNNDRSSKKSIDRGDDYKEFMNSSENDEKSSESKEEVAPDPRREGTTDDGVSTYSYSYSPENRTSSGLSYGLTFNFDTYLKNYDYYTETTTINRDAKITSVACNVQVGYQAEKSFSKALESKLTAAGWKKQSDNSYTNSTNGYTISVSGSRVTLSFLEVAAETDYQTAPAPESGYYGGDSVSGKY